jgi:hypothetical protein
MHWTLGVISRENNLHQVDAAFQVEKSKRNAALFNCVGLEERVARDTIVSVRGKPQVPLLNHV